MAPVESLSQALHDAAHETEPDVATAVRLGLERGLRMRRTRRLSQVAGATAAIIVASAAGVFVAGGTHHQSIDSPPHPTGTPTTTAPTSTPTPPPDKSALKNPYEHSSDKVLDLRMHMPALLQQLLPSGTTVAAAPKDWNTVSVSGVYFAVSNATGTSVVDVEAMPLDEATAAAGPEFNHCDQSHNATKPCQTLKVAGGTVYVADQDRTALDGSGGQPPSGGFQTGHERDVIWRVQQLTFVPDDNSRPYVRLNESTQIEAIPLANTPAVGSKGYQWPPPPGTVMGPTGTGVAISPADFAALVGTPQINQIEHLYDNSVPASQSAVAERNAINAQIATLAGPLLPPGVKITVNYSEEWHAFLTLTGPTGVNALNWYTDTRSHALQTTNYLKCQPDDHDCRQRQVPGADVQWTNRFDKAQPAGIEYVPDDPDGTAIAINLFPTDSASGDMYAAPGSKIAPPQLTYDQLLALATSPGIANVIHQANELGR